MFLQNLNLKRIHNKNNNYNYEINLIKIFLFATVGKFVK